MKKITLLFFLFSTFLSVAQQVVVQDFETPTSYNLNIFAGLTGSIATDPAPGGTRLNSLSLTSASTGEVYQGCEIIQLVNKFKLTTDKTMSIDVFSTQAFTMLAKVEGGTGAPNSGASQNYTTPNAWQTLTFTFTQGLDNTATADGSYGNLVLFPNWNPNNAGFLSPPGNFTLYVDNITSEATPIVGELVPTTAAPTPPNRPVADVKSLFSDVYDSVAVMNYAGVDGQPSNDNTYNTSWCSGSTSLIQVAGNNTNKITGLGCEGIAFLAGRIDANDFTRFHIDIWTPTTTQDKVFSFKFSNWGGTNGETNAYEYTATNANVLTSGAEGTWISIDLPFSAPTFNCINTPPGNGCPGIGDLAQFVITSNLGTVYYDNLYLHKNTVLGIGENVAPTVKMYPNPASNVLNIESTSNIEKVAVYNVLGQQVISEVPNKELVSIDVTNLQIGVYVVKTTIGGTVSSSRFIKE